MFIIFYFYRKQQFLGVAHKVAHRVAHKVAQRVAHGLAHGPGPRFCPHPIFFVWHLHYCLQYIDNKYHVVPVSPVDVAVTIFCQQGQCSFIWRHIRL